MRYNRFIEKAITIAKSMEFPIFGTRVAAIIVFKNKIISYANNQQRSDPFQRRFSHNINKIFVHAEISAIKKALNVINIETLKKCSIYTARVGYNRPISKKTYGDLIILPAFPCKICLSAIVEFGLKEIISTKKNEGYNIYDNREEFSIYRYRNDRD